MTYEPREDSFLLEKAVREHARGRVLDLGCGSGIQGAAALETEGVRRVTFADVDDGAVEACRRVIHDQRVSFVETDLFSAIEGRFDTIIFNPPYLPDDARVKDQALDGGQEGWEITGRFLEQAKAHLAPDGRILLLISSLTGKARVEAVISRLGLRFRVIGEQALDFERLSVYLIHHA